MNTDKILLSNLVFFAAHGVLEAEKALGQRFGVDLECGVDLATAGRSGELKDTVSYEAIFMQTKDVVETQRFDLLESLAEAIAARLFERFDAIEWVQVRVLKLQAPIPITIGEFGVQITRYRSGLGA